ncbi:MAG TPA: hypothetical protein VGE10_01670 [Zeimonas sp.]
MSWIPHGAREPGGGRFFITENELQDHRERAFVRGAFFASVLWGVAVATVQLADWLDRVLP